MDGQEGCEGLHGCSAGHFCLGAPDGNIVTKSISRQCFYGKPVPGYQGLPYPYKGCGLQYLLERNKPVSHGHTSAFLKSKS